MDTQARERERALADARDHLLLLSKTLARDQALLGVRHMRIAELETQVEQPTRRVDCERSGSPSLPPETEGTTPGHRAGTPSPAGRDIKRPPEQSPQEDTEERAPCGGAGESQETR